MNRTLHHGRSIKHFREMFGIKQPAFAHSLGAGWTPAKLTVLEKQAVIDIALLKKAAKILRIPLGSLLDAGYSNHLEKIIRKFETLVAAMEKKEALYEQALAEEKAKYTLLQQQLRKKK